MRSFVISLQHAAERRKHIVNEFGNQGVGFEFFDAITPEQNLVQAQNLGINLTNTVLGPGEVACLLSHVSVWQHAITQQIPYVTIFEDDVFLGKNAADFLNQDQWIPAGCDVIKLEGFSSYIFTSIRPTHYLPFCRRLYQLKHKHMGAAGYILSLHAAGVLLDYVQQHSPLRPIDHIVFDDYVLCEGMPVMQMMPAICMQDYILHGQDNRHNALPSYLEQDRLDIRKVFPKFKTVSNENVASKLGVLDKLKREIWRFVQQVRNLHKIIINKLSRKKVLFQ